MTTAIGYNTYISVAGDARTTETVFGDDVFITIIINIVFAYVLIARRAVPVSCTRIIPTRRRYKIFSFFFISGIIILLAVRGRYSNIIN